MADTQLNIWLRVKDQASAHLKGVQGRMRNFATTFKQNWIAITASITASIMAISKAWDLAELGAKADQIENSFASMATTVGINSEKMKNALQEASAGTTNFSNVANKASALLAQNLSMDQVVALMKQARAEAKLFGTTTEEAFSNIASAVTGGLVTTLRRTYGLQLSLKQAVEDYATETGKATEEVQQFHLASAIANHVLSQGKAHLNAVNLEMMSQYEQIQKLKASWLGFKEEMGQALLKLFQFIKATGELALSGLYKVWEGMIGLFEKALQPFVKLLELLGNLPGKAGESFKSMSKSLSATLDSMHKKISEASQNLANDAYEDYSLLFAKTKEASEQTGEIIAEQLKAIAEETNKAVEDAVEDTTEELSTETKVWQDLVSDTATNMKNSFANVFFKAFTGEVTSAKELFQDFGRSMLQTISQVISQYLVMKMFTGMGLGSIIGFQTGTPYIPKTGMYMLHKGESVVPAHENKGSSGGGNIIINQVIQAWDANDIYRNRKLLTGAIADEITKNSAIRGIIRNNL